MGREQAKHAEDAAFQIAVVYAARDEMDLAFEWLERAYVQREPGLSDMKLYRLLRPLHADPRWSAFLRNMGLAEQESVSLLGQAFVD